MNPKRQYRCNLCGRIHDDYGYAESCCKPIPISVWKCGDCGTQYSNRDYAEACCTLVPPNTEKHKH